MRSDEPSAPVLEVTDLLGGIGAAAPGPLFLVDGVGRVQAINAPAREMGEGFPAREAYMSTVTVGDRRLGHVVGYVGEGVAEEEAPLVSAIVALAADVLQRTLQRRTTVPAPAPAGDRRDGDLEDARERLASILDETAVAEIVVEASRRALDADAAVLLTLAEGRASLVPAAAVGVDLARVGRVAVGRSLVGWAVTRQEPTTVSSWLRLPPDCPRHVGARCTIDWWVGLPFVAIPLRSGSQVLAVLCLSGVRAEGAALAGSARRLERLLDRAAANLAGARIVKQVRREERIARELEIARQIQASLLPQEPADFAGLDVAGECRPAAQVGGDFLGFRVDSPGTLTATVFDAAGHGIGAAFCMTLVRSALNGELARGEDLGQALARANGLVFDDVASSGLFATALVARFARDEGRLEVGSAGHLPPIHWSARRRRFVEHLPGGLPLGLVPDGTFVARDVDFDEGDVVVVATDGVVEAASPSGERFGRARLLAVVRRNRRRSARQVLAAAWRELETFTGGAALADDATLLVVKGIRKAAVLVEDAAGSLASRVERSLADRSPARG